MTEPSASYNATNGAQVWAARHNGPGVQDDGATALGVSPDGARIYVTGYSSNLTHDYGTVAYDATTGGEVWLAGYDGPGSAHDGAFALGISRGTGASGGRGSRRTRPGPDRPVGYRNPIL